MNNFQHSLRHISRTACFFLFLPHPENRSQLCQRKTGRELEDAVSQLVGNVLPQCKTNSWLLNFKLPRSQELRSVSSYVFFLPQTSAPTAWCAAIQSLCTVSGTPAVGFISRCCNICPILHCGTFYLLCFYSRANYAACLETKAAQNSLCSHYCLIRHDYSPEITSAYSGNL